MLTQGDTDLGADVTKLRDDTATQVRMTPRAAEPASATNAGFRDFRQLRPCDNDSDQHEDRRDDEIRPFYA